MAGGRGQVSLFRRFPCSGPHEGVEGSLFLIMSFSKFVDVEVNMLGRLSISV